MFLDDGPVRCAHRRRAIGKVQGDRQRSRIGLDGDRNAVSRRMAAGSNPNGRAVQSEPALQLTVPKIEDLMDVTDILAGNRSIVEQKPDPPQIQTMRVLPQPVEQLFLTLAAGGVPDRSTVGVEVLEAQV